MNKLSTSIVILALVTSFSVSASGGWKGKEPSVLSALIVFITSGSGIKTKKD